MKRIKRASIVLIAVALVVSLTMVIPASAQRGTEDTEVLSSEFVLATMASSGQIEEVQVFNWLSLNGDGTVTVREEAAFDDIGGYQAVKGFTKPSVEGDYIVWPEISVDGPANVIATTKLGESNLEEARSRIPLGVRFKYWFDGEPVTDLETITGKSGRFKMELTLRNESKEMTEIEYKDPATGQMVTEEVETYLPMVILPYDWYFDNSIFFNLEADPTGLVVWMPDFYNVGWSIPLFPPATEESHTIWVAADVKDFAMPPLTLAVAFHFPETNQTDITATLAPYMKAFYDGMKQVNAGIGSPTTDPSLLFGITAVNDGLEEMAAQVPAMPEGLTTKLIPGLEQVVNGFGSETTDGSLIYGATQVEGGLNLMKSGIGSPTSADTMLYGMAAMAQGLADIQGGIGDYAAPAPDTLQYAMAAMQGGLSSIQQGIGSETSANTLLYAVAQVQAGLDAMKAGIGGAAIPNTLLYAVAQVQAGLNSFLAGLTQMYNGLGTTSTPNTVIWGLDQIQLGLADPGNPSNVYNALMGAYQQFMDPVTAGTVRNLVDTSATMAPAEIAALDTLMNTWGANMNDAATGVQTMYDALTAPLPNGIIPNLQSIRTGIGSMMAGIGAAATPGTLLYAMAQIQGGLQASLAGIGDATTANTLLWAMAQIQGGLHGISAGIGQSTVPDSLLYAVAAVQGGLLNIALGIGSATSADTLLYAVDAVEGGLNNMLAGIGDAGISDTLLWALASMKNGMYQMKAGLSSGDMSDPGIYEGLVQITAGLDKVVAGIGSAGTPDTLLYGTDQITTGMTDLNEGTVALEEGLLAVLTQFSMTGAELEAIAERGEEFDHFLGRAEDAENNVRFVYQSKPTYNYTEGSSTSWIVAIVLSAIIALGLVAGGILLARRSSA
ncbi:MAG: hypothetical protein AB1384_15565 [Actinomycetota bacterium]